MNQFYYLNSKKADAIFKSPSKAWDEFNANKLKPFQLDSPNETTNIENIACYSENHLYIIIKTKQEEITHRDRSYQNGDGFHLVLAAPKENNLPSDEFYVIGISPLATDGFRKFVWYKNIDLATSHLKDTVIKTSKTKTGIYIMAKIPWKEIQPIKGLLLEKYGYNISYVQATIDGKNTYILKEDSKIQSEQSLRKYLPYQFEKPKAADKIEYNLDINSKHCKVGGQLKLSLAINSNVNKEATLQVTCKNKLLSKKKILINKELFKTTFPVVLEDLPLGENDIDIQITGKDLDVKENRAVFIYDHSKFEKVKEDVNNLWVTKESTDQFIKESIISTKFQWQNMMEELKKLKPYEEFQKIESYYKSTINDLQKVKEKKHLF
ncbi:hypothetical protein PRVXH_000288 [Proteinivorax hydrogeniformans]|uniref:Uncharacterized protein n=1 Tax=Proteinivorax hydrogeniformans TaxID=1826727 RepID=A0AAU8HUF3_9FIRM